MAIFLFKAKRANGELISGKIKARDKNEVIYILKAKHLDPVIINQKKSFFDTKTGTVKNKDVVQITRQMSFLISSGIPIVQSLQIVKEITTNNYIQEVITNIINSIEKGSSFAQALSEFPHIFSNIYIHMIQAGEVGGSLDIMLKQLATDLEESEKIKSRVKKAMMYPTFVLTIGLVIIVIIMVFVVPKFVSMFSSSGKSLPAMTQILVDISDLFVNHLFALFVIGVLCPISFIMYLKSAAGRTLKDTILLVIPIIGTLILHSNLARLSRTLSSLLKGGVNMIDALDVSIRTANNTFIELAIKNVKTKVATGNSIALSLKQEKIIPPLLPNMVAIGEETGNIDATLEKVAEFYEEQVKSTTEAMSDLIQPILIVVLGGIVGFVVLALYAPIFKLPETML